MPAIEKDAMLKVSEVLSKNFVPLMTTLFYLKENDKDLNTFIEINLDHEPSAITEPLQKAGLIILEKGLFVLTDLGLRTSKSLQPN